MDGWMQLRDSCDQFRGVPSNIRRKRMRELERVGGIMETEHREREAGREGGESRATPWNDAGFCHS